LYIPFQPPKRLLSNKLFVIGKRVYADEPGMFGRIIEVYHARIEDISNRVSGGAD
jgi:hypothetical protein